MIGEQDVGHLRRCVELAGEAVDAGDDAFGSVLVSAEGEVLKEERNRISGGDDTRHPEFELARWAAENMTPEQRRVATMYTSGEHCPMCAAAQAWVGIGRIVYASSSRQLTDWLTELGAPASRVRPLAIEDVILDTVIEGPVPQFSEDLRALHARRHAQAMR